MPLTFNTVDSPPLWAVEAAHGILDCGGGLFWQLALVIAAVAKLCATTKTPSILSTSWPATSVTLALDVWLQRASELVVMTLLTVHSTFRHVHFICCDRDSLTARIDGQVLGAFDQNAVVSQLDRVTGLVRQRDRFAATRVVEHHHVA